MKIGWIGLGQMGVAMAARLVRRGYPVTAYVRSLEGREAARAAGVALTQDVGEAVSDADLVCVGLFDDAQFRALMLGPKGALSRMKPGAIVAVHTTGGPGALADAVAEAPAGVTILDATFSGTAAALEAGGFITLMVGGDAAALEAARPALAAYCDPITLVGPVGAARRLKLLNNLLFAAQVTLAAETLRLAESQGLDPRVAGEVLQKSSGASFAMGVLAGADLSARLKGLAHYLDKDADAARAAAAELGLDLGALGEAARYWGEQASKERDKGH
jgi:3-hydroxyisobutyrate dehydrogenase-like beta-hydroxyacid dehydrogenase